jgi:hypothetical protein
MPLTWEEIRLPGLLPKMEERWEVTPAHGRLRREEEMPLEVGAESMHPRMDERAQGWDKPQQTRPKSW